MERTCPRCEGLEVIKSGFACNKQRYKCKKCNCQFTRETPKGFSIKEKSLAITLYLSGLSMNAIAQIIGTTAQSVMRWIKDKAHELPKEQPQITGPLNVEIDEMHHYIAKKNKSSGSGKYSIIRLDDFLPGTAVIVLQKP
jgi:transposase-like protein